jgi:hypothetical protein
VSGVLRGSTIALGAACLLFTAAAARAEERCLPYEEFNTWAETTGGAAIRGRLVFDFVAPSLIDRYRADAVVADMADRRTMTPRGTACSGFQLKSWGDCRLPDDTRCTCSGARCDGVLKLEGFDECGPMPGEAPFDPWHSQPVFTEDGRTCHLELFFDAANHGYDLTCSGITIAPGRGENVFGIEITRISVLENVGGGNAFDGAVLSGPAIFCFDDGVPAMVADAGTDAGSVTADAGSDSGAIAPPIDSGPGLDGARPPRADAGRAESDLAGGCECRIGSDEPGDGALPGGLLLLLALGLGLQRRRR